MRRSGHRGCRTEHHVCCFSFCHWHESTTLNVRLPAPQAAAELWLHHGQPSAFESVTSNLVCLGNVDATKCTPCAAVMLAGCQSVDYVCFPPPPPSTRTPQITFIRHLQFRIACQYAGPGKIIAGNKPDTFDRSRSRLISITGKPWTPDHRDSRRAALWKESRSDSFLHCSVSMPTAGLVFPLSPSLDCNQNDSNQNKPFRRRMGVALEPAVPSPALTITRGESHHRRTSWDLAEVTSGLSCARGRPAG